MLNIAFEDFKRLALENNKRIYYYHSGDMMELFFLTEGIFSKTVLDLSIIEEKETFFGQKMFFGAVQLNFPITNGDSSQVSTSTTRREPDVLRILRPEESEGGADIQKEAVE